MDDNEILITQGKCDSGFHLVNASGARSVPDISFGKPFDNENTDNEILIQVVDYYHNTLKRSPKTLAALQKMGIDNNDVIEHFKLGFSDRSLGSLLPEKNRIDGASKRGRLQHLGILKATGHEVFRGSLVVPVIENGIVYQIYGHKVAKKLRPGTPVDIALLDSAQSLLNVKALHTCEELILCSSTIDALTFWCAGYKNVTCNDGLDYLPEYIIEILKFSPVKRIMIAYATTKNDDIAASNISEQLCLIDIQSYRIEFNKNMNANTYALNNQPVRESLGEAIRKAVWIGKDKQSEESQLDDIEGDNNILDTTPIFDEVINTPIANEVDHQVTIEPDTKIPATVLPTPAIEVDAEIKDGEIVMCLSNRRYRIRGLDKNILVSQLKVNILVSVGNKLHVDTFDLYSARNRDNYIKCSSAELGIGEDVLKKDLNQVLLKLELLQDKNIQKTLTPILQENKISKLDRAEAMHFLTSPNLVHRILEDFQRCGIVGEKTNKLVAYLASISRKLPKPLAVIIQSTSAAGKSALMDAVLSFVPTEERVQYSAITGQSLFYMGDINLKHKILAISEEEGANHATYALKLLQSEGQLTIASTGKDPDSGRHVTREYKVDGPVMIFSTTTAIDIDEELLNRCLVLSVDEDREQTRAIHDLQRFEETLEGLKVTQVKEDVIRVQHNAQRLIKPLKVVNPFARHLTFLDDKTRTRRDHKKYLTLINSVALLHQYQREVKKVYCSGKPISYVEVTLDDIGLANQLAHKVLGSSLDDLPPQTRKLLMLIDSMVSSHCDSTNLCRNDYRFSRRDVRSYTGWGDTQLKVHIKRLENMEYLLIHHGGRGRKIIYELLYNSEGEGGDPFLMGLIDIEILKKHADGDKQSGLKPNLSTSSQTQVGDTSDTCQSTETATDVDSYSDIDKNRPKYSAEVNMLIKHSTRQGSYRSHASKDLDGGNLHE